MRLGNGRSAESVDLKTINGSVFITDIIPQSDGNVGDKTFSSDGEVLDSCLTDTQLINVSVIAIPGESNYKPVITIKGNIVPLTAQSDAPLFRGNIDIDIGTDGQLTAVHEDGAEHTTIIAQETPPEIQSAYFTGGYPGSQTELKENDSFDFFIESDVPITGIQFDNYGAFKPNNFNVTEGTTHTITGTIANRGTSVQNLGAKVKVQKSTGSWSDWYKTEDDGSVDGINLVSLNNLYPSFNFNSITYPTGQEALKNNETADVSVEVLNYDTVNYTSPNGDLSIASSSTYAEVKTVTRVAGGYNVSTNNYQIEANRAANDATSNYQNIVQIADTTCSLSINLPSTRLRSGGNDNTSAQNHTITINSNQNLLSAPSLSIPVGTWQGSGFTGSGGSWSRDLQVHDDDIKGTYSFSSISGINLAGIETTIITGSDEYTLGGFVTRDIPLDPFAYETSMNVEATIYNKVTLSWSFSPDVTSREALGSTPVITGGWCLDALNVNPTAVRILDDAYNSSSQESTITIQEAV